MKACVRCPDAERNNSRKNKTLAVGSSIPFARRKYPCFHPRNTHVVRHGHLEGVSHSEAGKTSRVTRTCFLTKARAPSRRTSTCINLRRASVETRRRDSMSYRRTQASTSEIIIMGSVSFVECVFSLCLHAFPCPVFAGTLWWIPVQH